MRLLTREIEVALNLLQQLYNHPNSVFTAAELAEGLQEPKPFVEQVLNTLKNNQYVISRRGPGGGFLHSPDVETLSLAQFLEAMGSPLYVESTDGKKVATFTGNFLADVANKILILFLVDRANNNSKAV